MKYTLALAALVCASSCSKDEIPYYNSLNDAVGFNKESSNGYDISTKTLYRSYSFVEHPLDESTLYDIPLTLIGNISDKDRKVSYAVNKEKTTAPNTSYEIQEAIIPANSYTGHIRVKIYNPSDDSTFELNLILQKSSDLALGPVEYQNASLSWNNVIPAPTSRYNIITYNMLIQGTSSFSSTSLSYYSPNALKTIVAAFGWNNWNDKSAYPQYAYPISYFAYAYLPDYRILYAEGTYSSFAAKLEDYIDDYNATHDEPLLHDAGALSGKPIQARKY